MLTLNSKLKQNAGEKWKEKKKKTKKLLEDFGVPCAIIQNSY